MKHFYREILPRARTVEAELKIQPGLSIELAETTKNWFLFDTELRRFFYTANLPQAVIEKTFHNLE